MTAGSSSICIQKIVGGDAVSPHEDTAPVVSPRSGWMLHDFSILDSSNLTAAALPPWNAVRARTQTAGRGRFQRSWISDEGGLWLSAVVPVAGQDAARGLPLLAALALSQVMDSLGVKAVRMRWPNDILVRGRKLAGILVDSFRPQTAVIGIGVNVANQPEALDPALRSQTARLADLLLVVPTLDQLTSLLLRAIRREMDAFATGGNVLPAERINLLWGAQRAVELDLDGSLLRGMFTGVDQDGRLGLRSTDGTITFFAAHQVRHLTEIDPEP